MRLSERLETILSQCGTGEVIADIGCDHGFASIELVARGQYRRAIAMDVRKGPLSAAQEHIRERGLADRIETRLSDGLDELAPGEADAILIAGMGGALMSGILFRHPEIAKSASRLVLSPQSEIGDFRRKLILGGFSIRGEELLREDGKTYVVITAVPGQEEPWEDWEYRYGRDLVRRGHPLLEEQLLWELHRDDALIEALAQQEGGRGKARREELAAERETAARVLSLLRERSPL